MGTSWKRSGDGADVRSDAVVLASLLPMSVRQRIADQLCVRPAAPEVLLARSAVGLNAALAYDAVPVAAIGDLALAYCGEIRADTSGRRLVGGR